MVRIQQVLSDFCGDVQRARHLLELIKTFREFGASEVPAEIQDGNPSWEEAGCLWDASKQRRTDLPWLSGSLLLYIAGRFEYFARQLVEAVAEDLTDGASEFSDLPESLRKELKARTLEVAQNPRRYGFSEGQAAAFLETLVDNLKGVTPCTINAAVVSLTESNLKDRALAELLKRVGVEQFWREVGKQSPMKLFLEKTDDGQATVEAQSRLNSLMDDRNQIAHPTAQTSFPDPDQVLRVADFLEALSRVTVDVVGVQMLSLAGATEE